MPAFMCSLENYLWTLTGRQEEESADLSVRSVPAGNSGSHIIAQHRCANLLCTYFREVLDNYHTQIKPVHCR